MEYVATHTIDALRAAGTEELPRYEDIALELSKKFPPPFGQAWYGEKYRTVASGPEWLALSLVANAAKEGEGSQKLWMLAAKTPTPSIAEAVRQHAIDESRHAQLYLVLLDLVFPEALDEEARRSVSALSPRYTQRDRPAPSRSTTPRQALDELLQMNIGEIRTRIHQLLMRPVIAAYCPEKNRGRLTTVLDSLLHDETRHIQYTARLIEAAMRDGEEEFVRSTLSKRWQQFNELTLEEVGESKFVGE